MPASTTPYCPPSAAAVFRRRRGSWRTIGPDLCNLAGISCFHLGQFQRALKYYQFGLAYGRLWKIHANMATLFLTQGMPEDALEEARNAFKLNPESVHVRPSGRLPLGRQAVSLRT